MFRGFNLTLERNYKDKHADGLRSVKSASGVTRSIQSLLDSEGHIIAEKLIAEWFPQKKFDLFISHSHRDIDKVTNFCGYLKNKFDLDCFVDSYVWEYCDDLLRKIDDKYCLNKGEKTYNYKKRNNTTAHVHSILSVALAKMMDQCECVFFINTPHSVAPQNISNSYSNESKTFSPWIYFEISMLDMIQIRNPYPRENLVFESRQDSVKAGMVFDSATIKYAIDFNKMTSLNDQNISTWYQQKDNPENSCKNSLDILYDLFPKKEEEFKILK